MEWQHMLGWINWGLNTFPLLKLGLQSSYTKVSGKFNAHMSIYSNRQVISDLHWVADTMDSTGLYYFEAAEWSPLDADIIIYCDASLSGLGFYCPERTIGFHANITDTALTCTIFYNEACLFSQH